MKQRLIIPLILSVILILTLFVSAETIESFQFEKASNKLNLGESLSDFSNKLDDNDFPRFLEDLDIDGYEYSQEIVMGNLVFENFSNSRYNDGEYTLGIEINRGDAILNYTVDFRDYPTLEFIEQKQIYFLGREYTIVKTNLEDINMTLEDSEGNLLEIRSGRDMEFNSKNLNDAMTEIILEGDKLVKIVVPVIADDRYFVADDSDFSLQYLNSLKLRFNGIYDLEGELIGNVSLEAINYDEQIENVGVYYCYDSDEGDYYIRGVAEGNFYLGDWLVNETNGTYEDYCYDSENIMEFKCYTETSEYDVLFGETYIREVSKLCPHGCEEGACLEEEENEDKNYSCEVINGTCIDSKNPLGGNYDSGADCGDNEKFICYLGPRECDIYNGTCVENRYAEPPVGYILTDYDCEQGSRVDCWIPNQNTSNETDENCPSLGYRKSGDYCSEDGNYVTQRSGNESCENDFECLSNSCIDDMCVEKGFWTKLFEWFRNLFGGN